MTDLLAASLTSHHSKPAQTRAHSQQQFYSTASEVEAFGTNSLASVVLEATRRGAMSVGARFFCNLLPHGSLCLPTPLQTSQGWKERQMRDTRTSQPKHVTEGPAPMWHRVGGWAIVRTARVGAAACVLSADRSFGPSALRAEPARDPVSLRHSTRREPLRDPHEGKPEQAP